MRWEKRWDGWRALSLRECSARRERLELHLEKDLELKIDRDVLLNCGCGPIFWKVIMEELWEGEGGREWPNDSLSASSRGTPSKVVWVKARLVELVRE